jgi:hypothetical protein
MNKTVKRGFHNTTIHISSISLAPDDRRHLGNNDRLVRFKLSLAYGRIENRRDCARPGSAVSDDRIIPQPVRMQVRMQMQLKDVS